MSSSQQTSHIYRGFPTRFLMRLSTMEGGFAQVHQILTAGMFLTVLALALGARPWHLGFLAAIPHMTQIFQLIGAYLVEATGRRKLVSVWGAVLSRLVWLGMPILFWAIGRIEVIPWFLALVIAASALEHMSGNAWTTWMADLIPDTLRGRYFGYRHAVLAAVTIVVTLAGGLWLEWGRGRIDQSWSLTWILLTAAISGMVSVALLARQPDISRPADRKAPKVRELILRPMRSTEFRRALQFFLVWNLAVGFAAAFFQVHMIRVLHMSYLAIGLFQAIKPMIAMLIFRRWGLILDRFAVKSVLLVSGCLITILPLLWLLPTEGHIGWLWIIAALSGIGWTGFNLSAYTYPMQHSPRIGRSYFLAYFSIVSGVGFVVASITGGLVAEWLDGWQLVVGGRVYMGHHVLFIITAFGRLAALMMLLRLPDVAAPGALTLITRIGAGIWRTASLGRPFPRWIQRRVNG
ncbi:MAG: MFS transporter [Candidatus Neomarinimicrobiota bacterium]